MSIEIAAGTRYYWWQSEWQPMDEDMFAYHRDHDDSHFSVTSLTDIAALVPDALIQGTALHESAVAQAIATEAHRGQQDKLGIDYITHPARIAAGFDPITQRTEHCAAWLHDVIEDSSVTAEELLAQGVQNAVVEVVLLLTRRDGVASDEYYRRIAQHPVAVAVKRADIADNTLEWRTSRLDPETRGRLAAKHAHALELIGEPMNVADRAASRRVRKRKYVIRSCIPSTTGSAPTPRSSKSRRPTWWWPDHQYGARRQPKDRRSN